MISINKVSNLQFIEPFFFGIKNHLYNVRMLTLYLVKFYLLFNVGL